MVVRENTEGLYTGAGGFLKKGTPDEVAIQESINTRKGVERCLKFAFELARKRNRAKKLTLVAKTNVLTYRLDLWERAFEEMAPRVPGYHHRLRPRGRHLHVVREEPRMVRRDVTDNMFGDIITDLGAMIQGGMGIAAGGNINPEGVSMFEPIGGSRPEIHRPERHQPDGGHRRGPDDAGQSGRGHGRRPRRSGHQTTATKTEEHGGR